MKRKWVWTHTCLLTLQRLTIPFIMLQESLSLIKCVHKLKTIHIYSTNNEQDSDSRTMDSDMQINKLNFASSAKDYKYNSTAS